MDLKPPRKHQHEKKNWLNEPVLRFYKKTNKHAPRSFRCGIQKNWLQIWNRTWIARILAYAQRLNEVPSFFNVAASQSLVDQLEREAVVSIYRQAYATYRAYMSFASVETAPLILWKAITNLLAVWLWWICPLIICGCQLPLPIRCLFKLS